MTDVLARAAAIRKTAERITNDEVRHLCVPWSGLTIDTVLIVKQALAADRLARNAEVLARLEHVPCGFFACPGPDEEPVDMATCHVCWLIYDLRHNNALAEPA